MPMRVRIVFKDGREEIDTAVTEIHYLFPPDRDRVAFESDIRFTGRTIPLGDIKEFEAIEELEITGVPIEGQKEV